MSIFTRLHDVLFDNVQSNSVLSRKIDLTYRISLLFLALALPYIPIFLFLHLYLSTIIVIITILMFFTSILLNKFKWHNISKVILIAGPAWSFFTCANVLSQHSGAQLLLFTLTPLPLLLFEITQIKWIVTTFLIPMILYIALELGHYNLIPYHEVIPNYIILTIRISSILTTFILLGVSVTRYFLSNRRYELKIEEKNYELEKNNATLLDKNHQIQLYLEKLTRAYKELEHKKRLDLEFEIASQQQQEFLPIHMPKAAEYLFESYFKGARGVSGDFYDYKCFGDIIKFFIADVRGKSLSAAFITVHLYSIFHSTITEESTAPYLLSTINKIFSTGRNSYEKAAAFAFNINTKTHLITYSNAGIGIALHVHENDIRSLDDGGFMIGGDFNEVYDEYSLKLDVGDIFIIASDGLEDVRNNKGELFGKERIYRIIHEYLNNKNIGKVPSPSLKTCFQNYLFEFQDKDLLPEDDIVFLIIERVDSVSFSN